MRDIVVIFIFAVLYTILGMMFKNVLGGKSENISVDKTEIIKARKASHNQPLRLISINTPGITVYRDYENPYTCLEEFLERIKFEKIN